MHIIPMLFIQKQHGDIFYLIVRVLFYSMKMYSDCYTSIKASLKYSGW
jgi:hypothetical protein